MAPLDWAPRSTVPCSADRESQSVSLVPAIPRNILFFGVTLVLTVLFLGRQLPSAEDSITRVKLAGLRSHGADCNVLVIGSSISFHGLRPKSFDAANGEAGVETRTYNMAMPGTMLGESYHLLQRIAEQQPEQLRWVLIEADGVVRIHGGGEFLSPKNIAWHDPESLPILIAYPEGLDLTMKVRGRYSWRNTVVTAYNALGIGRATPWVEESLGLSWKGLDRVRWLGPARDGFRPVTWNPDESSRYIRQRYLERRGYYHRQLKQLTLSRPDVADPRPSAIPLFERINLLADQMGVRVIYYTLRGAYEGRDCVAMAASGQIETLLRLDDAERFPELFDNAYYYDGIHFTSKGAEFFSSYMAQEFLASEALSIR